MPNITVHHLQIGQGERIPFLLEELNIPYNLKLYQRDPVFSPPELRVLHPMGSSPVLEDATFDPEHPLLLGESGAIVEYLIHKHGNGRLALPPTHPNYADYLYWFHFANSTLQPGIARRIGQKPEDPRYKLTGERVQRMLRQLEDRLASNDWLAGKEFTAADIMTVWSLTTMRKFVAADLTGYGAILDWLKRITSRPAYRTAKQKSDPDLVIDELISEKGPALFAPVAAGIAYRSKA